MTKFEFSCELWGYNKISKKQINEELIDNLFDDWKHSMKSFKKWKRENMNKLK